jgi:hypothetical protein
MSYRVHRFDVRMAKDRGKCERFLNDLDGEIRSITPHVTIGPFWIARVDFLYVVERLP